MDRTKYGRRLTFLNAYFSLAIVLVFLCAEIFLFCLIGKVSSLLLLWGMYTLLHSVWRCCRQIIGLRAGMFVVDNRVAHLTSGSHAFWGALVRGFGIVVVMAVVLGISLAGTVSRSNILFTDVTLSVLAIWAYLWLNRAAWEWRVNNGKIGSLEYVERPVEGETILPATEAGMRRYIRELGWLIRYGPWIGTVMVLLPSFFMQGFGWISRGLSFIAGIFILNVLSEHWRQARRDRKISRGELEDRLTLTTPVVTTVVTEQKPLFQRLRP